MSLEKTSIAELTTSVAGLLPEEVETFLSLCQCAHSYVSYAEAFGLNRHLADHFPHVDVHPIGHSKDSRPIEVCGIGDPSPDGNTAFVDASGHAPEAVGPKAATVLQQLFAAHPWILYRYGYDGALLSNHGDPDGMLLQDWGYNVPTIRRFVRGAWRGCWQDQVSWDYPTPGYASSCPESLASLSVLKEFNPPFYGQLHGTIGPAYGVASHSDKRMCSELVQVLESIEMPVNYNRPTPPNMPIIAPGVFKMSSRQTIQDAKSYGDAAAAPEPVPGGTSAIDHISDDTLMLVPEVTWVVGDRRSGAAPTPFTYQEAIQLRVQRSLEIIDHIAANLMPLESWVADHWNDSEVQRLYRAAVWWRDDIPAELEAELEHVCNLPPSPSRLTKAELFDAISLRLVNSLLYLGNVARLAGIAENQGVIQRVHSVMDTHLESLQAAHYIPTSEQVFAESLITLIGMRRAILT